MITTIEDLSLNAWPALQTMLYDGWVMRFADGYTKRANSVNPLYFSSMDIDEKIRFCEDVYQQRNLPVVFKMTPSVHPSNLDEQLRTKGYRLDSPTSVQTIDLAAFDLQRIQEAELSNEPSDAWLENFCRMSAVSTMHIRTLQSILTNIVPQRCFVSIKSNDRIVACGLGVLQSGHIGLFDIITDKEYRNQGYGRKVVTSILGWGRQNHARTGYLQVMLNNAPALSMYSKNGFIEQYQYWYRIK